MGDPYTWKQLKDGRNIVIADSGRGETRAWYIAGANPDAVIEDTNPVKPIRGQADPHTGLYCNKVGYAHYGHGTRCEAEYVPQEYLDTADESDTTDDWFDADGYTHNVHGKPPVIEKIKQSMNADGNADVHIWRFLDPAQVASHANTGIGFAIEVVASVQSTPELDTMISLLAAVRNEQGKIHKISGIDFEFSVEASERIDKDRYRFVYRWQEDPGIRNTVAWDGPVQGNWGPLGGYMVGFANDDYIIPPYSRLDTAPYIDTATGEPDPTQLPVLQVAPTRLRNDLGWMTLPGMFG